MTIFIYRWKIKQGKESQFEDNWSAVTKAIRDQCGSYGSRLHKAKNGDYLAYAQWPDANTRERCDLDPTVSEARALMRDAVEQFYPEEELVVEIDLLVKSQ